MKTEILIQKNSIIRAGNYLISISVYKTEDVGIISINTNEFIKFKNIRKGGKLEKLKRKFKGNLCSTEEFCFSFKTSEQTKELINFLKN